MLDKFFPNALFSEIERRLSRLGDADGYTQPQLQETENRILGEMQRQEHKNQRQLQALRKQLEGLSAGRYGKGGYICMC